LEPKEDDGHKSTGAKTAAAGRTETEMSQALDGSTPVKASETPAASTLAAVETKQLQNEERRHPWQ
jgi:hypothetical protein